MIPLMRLLTGLALAMLILTLPFCADGEAHYKRPEHNPDLDKRWIAKHGHVAPYTCRPFKTAADVDIEHIVAFAEARRSGLPESRAREFVNDPLNIAVAFPAVNRYEKRALDVAGWQPPFNRCWFAHTYQQVKDKYGLSYNKAERAAIRRTMARCQPADFSIQC